MESSRLSGRGFKPPATIDSPSGASPSGDEPSCSHRAIVASNLSLDDVSRGLYVHRTLL